jgi:CcmD family protein
MNMLRKISLLILPVLLCITAQAQTDTNASTDLMRSNGKIYVVVAVVLAILIGLFAYVYSLDRKISKMEKL